MQRIGVWMILMLIIAGMPLVACTRAPAKAATGEGPVRIEQIEGSSLKRVVLTEKAAERLGIQTVPVRDEKVARKRIVGAEVLDAAAGGLPALTGALVQVRLSESDLSQLDRGQPALVLPMSSYVGTTGLAARFIDAPPASGSSGAADAVHYVVESSAHGLAVGQRVRVEVTLSGSGKQRQVVPYTAVIYDLQGRTWAYTSPETLVFVRHGLGVDYIDGDLAVLSEGPSVGTAVVSVGAAELYGAETGVGGH